VYFSVEFENMNFLTRNNLCRKSCCVFRLTSELQGIT